MSHEALSRERGLRPAGTADGAIPLAGGEAA
jgi:hypothetical protein